MVTKTQSQEPLKLQKLNIEVVRVEVVGRSPLIQNRFTEEAQKGISDKQEGKGRAEKKKKNPMKLAESRLYLLDPPRDDCKYGHPGVGFKNAIIRAGASTDWNMTDLKVAFFVITADDGLVPIVGAEDWQLDSRRVVISKGTIDIRHRPRISTGWRAVLDIEYNASVISAEELVNLVELAGFGVGVGEYRPFAPGSSGPYGRFNVAIE